MFLAQYKSRALEVAAISMSYLMSRDSFLRNATIARRFETGSIGESQSSLLCVSVHTHLSSLDTCIAIQPLKTPNANYGTYST